MKSYIKIGGVVVLIIAGSILLIPDKNQLDFMSESARKKPKTTEALIEEKQAALEAKIASEGLTAQAVGDLADSYVSAGKTGKAIELMERYHSKYPKDIEMLDKLAVIYHVAGQDDNYIRILEEVNELAPSVNTSYILQARYSMLYGDTQPEKTIAVLKKLVKLQPDNIQNYKNLIFFQFKAKKDREVIETIKEFMEIHPNQMDYSFTFALVDQMIKQGDVNNAYIEAESWIAKNPEPALLDFSTMFYNANRSDLALKLLAGKEEIINKNPLLLIMNVKAAAAVDPKQALEIAANWMVFHPEDSKALEDFGNILFSSKYNQEVVTLYTPYKSMVMDNPKLHDIYREATRALEKTTPQDPTVLIGMYMDELKDRSTTEERRKALIYTLDGMGAWASVQPYAEHYTFQYRQDWIFLYEGMLKKHKDFKRLAAFRYKYSHTVPLTEKEKHYFVSIYVNESNKPEAERLMLQLAEGKPAKDRDVQGLLYIWGLRPTETQVDWIESRARGATNQDKLDWLQILNNIHAYERVIRVVQAVPPEQRNLALTKNYFDALRKTKNTVRIDGDIAAALSQPLPLDRLQFYTKAAQDRGLFKLAMQGYEKLILADPENIEYIKERGVIAYYTGDIESARAYLNDYYSRGGKDILAVFYFAELLQQSNTLQARPLFEETIRLMNEAPSLTLQERVLKAHSLMRLHRFQQAYEEMHHLLAENPDNKFLQLDYAEFLIGMREFDKSEQVLNQFTAEEPVTALAPWKISRKHILRFESTPIANELLLVYDKRTSALPVEMKQLNDSKPGWVDAIYPGYDTVLIITNPGKEPYITEGSTNLIIDGMDRMGKQPIESALGIRRELLHARIEQETLRGSDAIARLEKLLARHPHEVSVISGLAIAKRASGQRLAAMDLAAQANALDPENHWVNIMLADMKREDLTYVRGEFQGMHLRDNDQFISSLSGMQPVNRNLKLAARVENNLYHFKDLRRANGDIVRKSGTVQRGEVNALYEFEAGTISKSAIYLNAGDSIGFGQQVVTHDALGQITLYGEYKRSDWTFTERIPNHATRNRLGVVQAYSPMPEIYSFGSLATSSYSQDNKTNTTQSVSLSGNIHAPAALFNRAWEGIPVIVGYGLDAEYVTSSDFATNSNGDRYRLYPLISREVHFIDATWRQFYDQSLVSELTGGFAYDRLSGDSGPSIAWRIIRALDKGWELQLRASHGISFTQSGSGVSSAGGYVVRKFKP